MESGIKGREVTSPKQNQPQSSQSLQGSVTVEDYEIRIKTLAPKVDVEATRDYSYLQKLNCLFDPMAPQPNQHYARAAVVISAVVYALIFLSVAIFVIESLPQYQGNNSTFYVIEAICIGVFTLELLIRMASCASGKAFAKDAYNWIDICAVLPFYLDSVMSSGFGVKQGISLVFLRVVRLARVFRMLKLGQFSKPLQMVCVFLYTIIDECFNLCTNIYLTKQQQVVLVLIHSVDALFLLVFLLFISTILFSSLLYVFFLFFFFSFFFSPNLVTLRRIKQTSHRWIAEQSDMVYLAESRTWIQTNGMVSPFQSIPHTFWWCMCTLTTVGYGDHVPYSSWGKFVASICIIVGVFVLAFPVILISYNYSVVAKGVEEKLLESDESSVGDFCFQCGRDIPQRREVGSLLMRNLDKVWDKLGGLNHSLAEGSHVGVFRTTENRSLNIIFGGCLGSTYRAIYDPVLTVREVTREIADQTIYCTEVFLDSESLSKSIAEHVSGLGLFPENSTFLTCSKPVSKATISVLNLPPQFSLITSVLHHPGDSFMVAIDCKTRGAFLEFRSRLREYLLSVSFVFTHASQRSKSYCSNRVSPRGLKRNYTYVGNLNEDFATGEGEMFEVASRVSTASINHEPTYTVTLPLYCDPPDLPQLPDNEPS